MMMNMGDKRTGLTGHTGLADGCFSFFQSSCGMNYAVHTKGHSELAILVLLTFLAILVIVLIFIHPY